MNDYSIIPQPEAIQYLEGFFQCKGLPEILHAENPVFQNEAKVFSSQIQQNFCEAIHREETGNIRLVKEEGLLAKEAYKLDILPGVINLHAGTETGIYRGLQVLRQLFLSFYKNGTLSIPCGSIMDKPHFPWRGFMLDCSRNFFSPEFIKKLLDALSLHHINIFHWHLTDDQGWRFPVRAFPLLTEIGSKRRDHRLSGAVSGGFYTEDDIKDVVSYAARRHIDVVPEVDLPGHASAILSSYPGLGCTGGPYRVEDRFGIFEDVLCAGNDSIFQLSEAIFDSLSELFPSRYVHIGGDEVLYNNWNECPKCRKRLVKLNLTETPQLQSWITARFVNLLKDREKISIGWDETLNNIEKFPLPDDFIVMSWRGVEGGKKAASLGYRVIMAPQTNGCYLDHKPIDLPEEPGRLGTATIADSLRMDPISPEMDESAASLVLGGQGNLWTEVIYSGKFAEYMIFPRIAAIAENLWSHRAPGVKPNLEDFEKRLFVHQKRLDKLGILQYRGPLE